jgi:gliding motility-associated-like protein
VNNDGYPEILFNYAQGMTAFRYNPVSQTLQQMWQQSTSDLGGATVMTAFDFNQDDNVEVVYRDESHLRIIDGNTGINQAQFECLAPTDAELSVIVDLDRDGQAEIITSQSTYDVNHDFHANLIIFHAPANTTWAPARYVWNQHAYNTVNVNNDLTIPATNFNPSTSFTSPDNIVRRPFNNFLQQATTLDQYGRPFAQLMNLAITGEPAIEFQSDAIAVTMEVCNTGGVPFEPPMYVTIYTDSGQVVQTMEFPTALQPGDCENITLFISQTLLEDFGNPYPLRIALNDNGDGTAQYGNLQVECDTADNYWIVNGSPCKIMVPNVITPNGDGRNDIFTPQMEGEFTSLRMDIYNRWGKRVWHQESIDGLSWDASELSDGVYYCAIEYNCATTGKKRFYLHSSVTVIR